MILLQGNGTETVLWYCFEDSFVWGDNNVYKKLVLGQPNGKETLKTQITEVKKLAIFLSFSYYNFEF